MILNDRTISELIEHGVLVDLGQSEDCTLKGVLDQVNPNSLDLTIGKVVRYPYRGEMVTTYGRDNNDSFPFRREVECIALTPGDYCLAVAREYILMPDNLCGQVFLKSSLGRLFVNHMLAGVVDAGYEGRLTLEFKNDSNNTVYIPVGSRVVQLVLMQLSGVAGKPYGDRRSRYQGATEPEGSKEQR